MGTNGRREDERERVRERGGQAENVVVIDCVVSHAE